MKKVYLDCETSGLDPTIHQAYEVAWAVEDEEIHSIVLPHTLRAADPIALKVGRYFERGIYSQPHESFAPLLVDLLDCIIVGANPAFDAAFLRNSLGTAVWHYRLIDIEQGAYWLLGHDRPHGLRDIALELNDVPGLHDLPIPMPDHTAAGDVATTRAVHHALQELRELEPE